MTCVYNHPNYTNLHKIFSYNGRSLANVSYNVAWKSAGKEVNLKKYFFYCCFLDIIVILFCSFIQLISFLFLFMYLLRLLRINQEIYIYIYFVLINIYKILYFSFLHHIKCTSVIKDWVKTIYGILNFEHNN